MLDENVRGDCVLDADYSQRFDPFCKDTDGEEMSNQYASLPQLSTDCFELRID